MIRIPSKTIVPILSILLNSIVLTYFLILPLLTWLQDIVDFYEPALNETTPTIHIKDAHIEFEGSIPQQITLADGAIIFFDKTVNDSLIEAAPPRSVFIAEEELRFKTKKAVIDTVTFENIKVDEDKVVLDPIKVREKMLQYRTKVFAIIAIIAVIGMALMVYLPVNFAAGVGLMVDAFTNGPNSFKQMLNLSSILLLFVVLIGIIFRLGSFRSIKILALCYVVLTGVLIYAYTSLASQVNKMADK
jgi:hypothetical protein